MKSTKNVVKIKEVKKVSDFHKAWDTLESASLKYSEGNFTVHKFANNWKVLLDTPESRENRVPFFDTFEEAAGWAIHCAWMEDLVSSAERMS
jgi:hypothetical protein